MGAVDRDKTVRIDEDVVERTPEQIMNYARCVRALDEFVDVFTDGVFWAVFVKSNLIRRILETAQWGLDHKLEEDIGEQVSREFGPVLHSIQPPTEAQRREIEAFLGRIRKLFALEER
ncbi:MAG: hypothetical protein GXP31_05805 [Kiritimatiellaeota bacterium]|nr:hypothetical protein [Kiritimatiellota bacterium]